MIELFLIDWVNVFTDKHPIIRAQLRGGGSGQIFGLLF